MSQSKRPAPSAAEKRLSVRVPADLHQAAREKSQRTGVTLAHVVRKALERWVAENQPGKEDPTQT